MTYNPSETTLPPCKSRRLDVWRLRRINDPAYGTEHDILPRRGEAGEEIPLTNADVLDHCAKTGRCAADVLCRRVNGPDCPFEEDTPRFDPVRRTFSYAGRPSAVSQEGGKPGEDLAGIRDRRLAPPHREPLREVQPVGPPASPEQYG